MKRVIFLNRFFFPDHSATSQLLSDLAFHLAGAGIDTHVITSRQLYEEPDAQLPSNETVRGVHIHRVATTSFGRSTLWGRSVDYVSYYLSTWRSLFALTRRGDMVIAMTDPPLISLFAMPVAWQRRAFLINWLQDIYPETAIQLNIPLLKSPIGRGITILRDRSLRTATANVVVGKQMARQVISRKVSPDRVHVIPNWTDDNDITPISHASNPLRQQWGLEDKFVVGYSGNLGRAHEFDTLLAAAELLKDDHRIVFVCVGGGHSFDDLSRRVNERSLQRTFRFFPYQDRSMLKYSLSVADVHWISLKPQLEGLIVPSKLYGVAAAGRAIVAIAAKNGEIAQLVEQSGCGVVIKPGDAKGLAEILIDFSRNTARVAEMGRRAREMLEAHFTRRHAFERWGAVLDGDPG
jgi:colanic acid biosynthesis glycosyl transferase WcaI